MSVPRISGFARLANGNVTPARIIEGQNTSLSRTMHGLAYDEIHDEIIVPVALSGAVLVFKGGATGDEPPLRVIQGSKTGLIRPQTVEVDPVHNEIVAADSSSRAILIFDRQRERRRRAAAQDRRPEDAVPRHHRHRRRSGPQPDLSHRPVRLTVFPAS